MSPKRSTVNFRVVAMEVRGAISPSRIVVRQILLPPPSIILTIKYSEDQVDWDKEKQDGKWSDFDSSCKAPVSRTEHPDWLWRCYKVSMSERPILPAIALVPDVPRFQFDRFAISSTE
jgi:hypothetical protein